MEQQTAQDLKELQSITLELKRLRTKCKELSTQKSDIEARISEYLETINKAGVRFENITIMRKERKKQLGKKKATKETDARVVLENAGVSNASDVLKELQTAMKGESVIVNTITWRETIEK